MIQQEISEKDIPSDIYDKLNSLDLRSDLENDNIKGCVLRTEGYVGNRPKDFIGEEHEDDTWAIDCLTENGDVVVSYLYVSEYEYNQDVEVLSISNETTENLNISDVMFSIYEEMRVDLRLLDKTDKTDEFKNGFKDALHGLSMIIEQQTGIKVERK